MLKLDIEGFEAQVVYSLGWLLKSRRIQFLVFEYAKNRWRDQVLEHVIQYFYSVGYMCFLLTREQLWPVGGPFWVQGYVNIVWSNFLCGVLDDPVLIRVVEVHNESKDVIWESYIHSVSN